MKNNENKETVQKWNSWCEMVQKYGIGERMPETFDYPVDKKSDIRS